MNTWLHCMVNGYVCLMDKLFLALHLLFITLPLYRFILLNGITWYDVVCDDMDGVGWTVSDAGFRGLLQHLRSMPSKDKERMQREGALWWVIQFIITVYWYDCTVTTFISDYSRLSYCVNEGLSHATPSFYSLLPPPTPLHTPSSFSQVCGVHGKSRQSYKRRPDHHTSPYHRRRHTSPC